MLSGFLERIAEAIARGITRGFLQEWRKPRVVYPEEPTNVDLEHAHNFANAIRSANGLQTGRSDSEPASTSSSDAPSDGVGGGP